MNYVLRWLITTHQHSALVRNTDNTIAGARTCRCCEPKKWTSFNKNQFPKEDIG